MRPRVSVVLTTEARDLFAKEALRVFLVEGAYLNCDSVEERGSFLHLKVRHKKGRKEEQFEVDLPAQYVLYCVSAATASALGFMAE